MNQVQIRKPIPITKRYSHQLETATFGFSDEDYRVLHPKLLDRFRLRLSDDLIFKDIELARQKMNASDALRLRKQRSINYKVMPLDWWERQKRLPDIDEEGLV